MNAERLTQYGRHDVSDRTSLSVCGYRTINPRGALIHTTSGSNSLQWLQGGSADAGTPASADALILRDGQQYLITPPGRYAYHAGQSRVQLDRKYEGNEVSQVLLGIELECLDTEIPTWQQYDSLADLICYYALHWGWTWPYLYYGHYGVAIPLGRRSDPVQFDWAALMGRLYVRTVQGKIPGI